MLVSPRHPRSLARPSLADTVPTLRAHSVSRRPPAASSCAPRAPWTAPLTVLLLAAASQVVACSGGFFPAPFATDSGPADSASAGPRPTFLTLGELTWSRGGEKLVQLRADGTLLDHGVVLGKLSQDGVFTSRAVSGPADSARSAETSGPASDTRRTLTMQPDGSVHVSSGFDIVIDMEGTAITKVHGQPDESLTLAQVTAGHGGKAPLSIEGASVQLRRTAMWILMIPDLLHIRAEEEQ